MTTMIAIIIYGNISLMRSLLPSPSPSLPPAEPKDVPLDTYSMPSDTYDVYGDQDDFSSLSPECMILAQELRATSRELMRVDNENFVLSIKASNLENTLNNERMRSKLELIGSMIAALGALGSAIIAWRKIIKKDKSNG